MRNQGAVSLRRLDNEDDYEAVIGKCSGITGYHRWFFLAAFAKVKGLRLEAFAVETRGETIGAFPVLLRSRGLISMANDVHVPNIGPVALEQERLPDVLRAADNYLRNRRAVVAKWCFAPGLDVPPEYLTRFDFRTSYEENFMVPADRSPAEQLAAMNRNLRREIRSAESRGWYVQAADNAAVADWFADHIGNAYQRKGETPEYTREMALRLIEILGCHPRMLWRSVHDGAGQLIALTASIIDNERLWCWLLVGDHNRRPSPHALAYWDFIQWSLSCGLACDFSGAPNEGIRNFKLRGLGSVVEHSLKAERMSPAAYRALRNLHGMSRKYMGRD